jgi:putative PIN family toxin of toxin-antitoxin system
MRERSSLIPKVVLDTTIIFAATFHPEGVAAKVLRLLEDGEIAVVISNRLRSEYEDTVTHPAQRVRFPFVTEEDARAYLNYIDKFAERIPNPPTHLSYPRDFDDEHIVNLIIEIRADFLVALDKDLLSLSEFPPFREVLPEIQVLRPGAFLRKMEQRREQSHEPEHSLEPPASSSEPLL